MNKSKLKAKDKTKLVLGILALISVFLVPSLIASVSEYTIIRPGEIVTMGEGANIGGDLSLTGILKTNNIESNLETSAYSAVFDTGEGTYPSIAGTHTGTFTPEEDMEIYKIYTYKTSGSGGHSEEVTFYEGGSIIGHGTWNGYVGDYQYITFDEPFKLYSGITYDYEIITGSFPQIIHKQSLSNSEGTITCTEFIDVNGASHTDWIPAIRLETYETIELPVEVNSDLKINGDLELSEGTVGIGDFPSPTMGIKVRNDIGVQSYGTSIGVAGFASATNGKAIYGEATDETAYSGYFTCGPFECEGVKVVGDLEVTTISSQTGNVVCIRDDGTLGTCGDQPDENGKCTCR